jgi:hypothetical protein
MTDPPSGPLPYRVSYSGRVRDALRDLVTRARGLGLGPQVIAAIQDIDHRLRIYPQFGEPLPDLTVEPAQLWVGVVPPLVVQYVIDEARRQVMVVLPLMPLPDSGL